MPKRNVEALIVFPEENSSLQNAELLEDFQGKNCFCKISRIYKDMAVLLIVLNKDEEDAKDLEERTISSPTINYS